MSTLEDEAPPDVDITPNLVVGLLVEADRFVPSRTFPLDDAQGDASEGGPATTYTGVAEAHR